MILNERRANNESRQRSAFVSLTSGAMTGQELEGAFALLLTFLASDKHYLDSSAAYGDAGPDALKCALRLFLARPELGFVWLVWESGKAVGCCVVCYAISTSAGDIVAKLDDVCVLRGREGQGIGTALIDTLKVELRRRGVRRIDTSCHFENARARDFYARLGFRRLNEERLALVL